MSSEASNPLICYEDNHLWLVYKQPGEPVQADRSGDTPLIERIKSHIKHRDQKLGAVFCGLVHRIDRPVSGLLVLAKTSKALSRLNQAFQNRSVSKEYLAVVPHTHAPERSLVTNYLLRNTQQNKSYICKPNTPKAQLAELEYETLAVWERYRLLKIRLFTGRHHQIRVQLAALGMPIKGDLKYGATRSNPDGSIHLHSYFLKFKHPVRDELLEQYCVPLHSDPLWKLARTFVTSNSI